MGYKVLYRKYRPSNFDEVVGQNMAIKLLKDSVILNKTSHAYIFSGPRGTGKTSTAKILAKTLNCLNSVNGCPCNECENCVNFQTSNDIFEIDAASNNGVDQIREIIDNIKLLPISSKYKIYIIDEVHMLSQSAFNALLLTLEEPPAHAIFILATTDIEAVPITILSRCQRIDFKKISKKDIIENLLKISEIEKIDITEEAIGEIAEYSDGGMRDALSLLDQMSKLDKKIDVLDVQNTCGYISQSIINELINDFEQGKMDAAKEIIENFKSNAIDYKIISKKVINCLKNRLIDDINYLKNYDLYREVAVELAKTLSNLSINVDSYDILTIILLKLCHKEHLSDVKENDVPSFDNVIEKKEFYTNNDSNNDKNLKFVDIRINNCFVSANKIHLQRCKDLWDNFICNVSNKKVKSELNGTTVVLASDTIIIIFADILDKFDIINNDIIIIESLFNELNDTNFKIACVNKVIWDNAMSNFMKNKKNGISYTFIDENESTEDTKEVNDIFLNVDVEYK